MIQKKEGTLKHKEISDKDLNGILRRAFENVGKRHEEVLSRFRQETRQLLQKAVQERDKI